VPGKPDKEAGGGLDPTPLLKQSLPPNIQTAAWVEGLDGAHVQAHR